MAYTGSEYFMKVKLSGNTEAKVRDHDLNEFLTEKGSMLVAGVDATGGKATFSSIPIGTQNQILAVGDSGLPIWKSAGEVTGSANDGPLMLSLNGNASQLFTADQASTSTLSFAEGTTNGAIAISDGSSTVNIPVHGLGDAAYTSITNLENTLVSDNFAKKSDIGNANLVLNLNGVTSTLFTANATVPGSLSFAEGSTNGAFAVNGTAIPIHGLGSAAFAETSDFDDAGAAADALQDAKDYTDEKIGDLGSVMSVVGTGATPTAYTTPVQGDVYIVNSGDDAGKEFVYTGSDWELLGMNEIDLTDYVKSEDLGALALKDNVSVPANTFVTELQASTSTQNISVLTAQASSISNYQSGSVVYTAPTFSVSNGILSLVASNSDVVYTAPTFTNTVVAPTTVAITHNTYSAVKNSAAITLTLS